MIGVRRGFGRDSSYYGREGVAKGRELGGRGVVKR